jgi:hypothetical protein
MVRSSDLMPRSSGRSLPRPSSAGFVAIPPLCAILSGGTAALIFAGQPVAAGFVALVCAALLVTAETRGRHLLRDMDDARARRFKFGLRVYSPIFDASILLPLAWTQRVTAPRITAIALAGLGASYLVSYQLARGQGLGYIGWDSAPFRMATAALLLFALLGGTLEEALLEAPLWLFAVISAAAVFRRAWDVRKQDRGAVASRGPA